MRGHGRTRACLMVGVAALGFAASSTALAAEKVLITGGEDTNTHEYWWMVRNNHTARIVRIEFPHWAADLFYTPATWQQGKQQEMNLVNVNWSKEPGVCWATPLPPYTGLATGQTAKFGVRISNIGALAASGTVKVSFGDGTTALIPGVQLPTKPPTTSPLAALVGTGAIFVLFIVIRERKRRKQPSSSLDDND